MLGLGLVIWKSRVLGLSLGLGLSPDHKSRVLGLGLGLGLSSDHKAHVLGHDLGNTGQVLGFGLGL